MLILCPECGHQISDRAVFCPSCGFPICETSDKQAAAPVKAAAKSRKSKTVNRRRRLPNGFGQITELKRPGLKRRFRVSITVGGKEDGKCVQQLLRPQAYFETYNEAYSALQDYHRQNAEHGFEDRDMTMQKLFDAWLGDYQEKDRSKSALAGYQNAWSYVPGNLRNKLVADVRIKDIKDCVEHGYKTKKDGSLIPVPKTVRPLLKILFNLLFDTANILGVTSNGNISRQLTGISGDVGKEIRTHDSQQTHRSFTDDELNVIWRHMNDTVDADLLLIQSYTGFRPQELCLLKVKDIHLDDPVPFAVGGMKTEAGFSRKVPIHPDIMPFVRKRFDEAVASGSENLILAKTRRGRGSEYFLYPVSYHRYREIFNRVLQKLGISDHAPHDCRKTFATVMTRNGADEYILKILLGHRLDDLTQRVYVDRTLEDLYAEILKIPTKKVNNYAKSSPVS